jgi:hypothetical protein
MLPLADYTDYDINLMILKVVYLPCGSSETLRISLHGCPEGAEKTQKVAEM